MQCLKQLLAVCTGEADTSLTEGASMGSLCVSKNGSSNTFGDIGVLRTSSQLWVHVGHGPMWGRFYHKTTVRRKTIATDRDKKRPMKTNESKHTHTGTETHTHSHT